MRFAVLPLVFIILCSAVFAAPVSLDHIRPDPEMRYYLRLTGGDILTGVIVDVFEDQDKGEAIKFKTSIGTATIYASQIEELSPVEEAYPHSHRVFLMPSAEPIGRPDS